MATVEELLKDRGIKYMPSGSDYLIKCLNPDHDDSNPSCRVDKIDGKTHCFSCGFKTNIYKYFGVISGNQVSIRVARLKDKIFKLKASAIGLEFPVDMIPYTKVFRGISLETLKLFEAFSVPEASQSMPSFEDRIIFPIRDIVGKIIGFIGRHKLSNGNPKYLISPANVNMPIFPAKVQSRSIILVEGIFDFLNCYDKGLKNVVCIFGTRTLQKDIRDKLLPFKIQGVEKVYLMLDPDTAGKEAASKLKPLIEAQDFQVEVIELEEGTDPGDLTQDTVNMIKGYIDDQDSSNRQSTH